MTFGSRKQRSATVWDSSTINEADLMQAEVEMNCEDWFNTDIQPSVHLMKNKEKKGPAAETEPTVIFQNTTDDKGFSWKRSMLKSANVCPFSFRNMFEQQPLEVKQWAVGIRSVLFHCMLEQTVSYLCAVEQPCRTKGRED